VAQGDFREDLWWAHAVVLGMYIPITAFLAYYDSRRPTPNWAVCQPRRVSNQVLCIVAWRICGVWRFIAIIFIRVWVAMGVL
jgi:hypothetical protein